MFVITQSLISFTVQTGKGTNSYLDTMIKFTEV